MVAGTPKANFGLMYTLKKSLGQHFLKDENISRKISEAIREVTTDNLLEVGPGGGALTKYLLEFEGVNLKAVELDDEKVAYLQKNYPRLADNLINKSILEIEKPFEGDFTIAGNFPYNISTQILFKILDWQQFVPFMIGMFQKEVAQRVAAKEGSKVYGVTSVLVQAFYDVEYLFDVEETAFTPPPKIKSGVIKLSRRQKAVEFSNRAVFFNLVKTAFNQRRKTLRNACKALFPTEVLQQPIFGKRAEQLSVEDFAELSFLIKPQA